MPSSSSHALIGGVIGATIAAAGPSAVSFHGTPRRPCSPRPSSRRSSACSSRRSGPSSPTALIRLLSRGRRPQGLPLRADRLRGARLAGPRHQRRPEDDGRDHPGADRPRRDQRRSLLRAASGSSSICAVAIAAGTAIGGWRIINTMGNRLTELESPQGFAAEAASGATILASSYYGYPLSTTQVVSGGVMGAGLGKKLASVHWGVAGQMVDGLGAARSRPPALIGAGAWEITEHLRRPQRRRPRRGRGDRRRPGRRACSSLAQRNKIGPDDLDRTHVSPLEEAKQGDMARGCRGVEPMLALAAPLRQVGRPPEDPAGRADRRRGRGGRLRDSAARPSRAPQCAAREREDRLITPSPAFAARFASSRWRSGIYAMVNKPKSSSPLRRARARPRWCIPRRRRPRRLVA